MPAALHGAVCSVSEIKTTVVGAALPDWAGQGLLGTDSRDSVGQWCAYPLCVRFGEIGCEQTMSLAHGADVLSEGCTINNKQAPFIFVTCLVAVRQRRRESRGCAVQMEYRGDQSWERL